MSLSTLDILRRALLLILLIGLIGTEVELLLLGHTDGAWQLAPIALVGLALLVLGWFAVRKSATAIRSLQATMFAFIVSGAIGVVLHYRGNIAYERDSNPSLSGRELYRSAVSGSTPTLAPGTMIQLGLVGLAFAFRHPGLRGRQDDEPNPLDGPTPPTSDRKAI